MNTTPDEEAAPDVNALLKALVAEYLEQRDTAEGLERLICNKELAKENALKKCVSLRDHLKEFHLHERTITVVVDDYAMTLTREDGDVENTIIICPVLK